MAYAIVQEKQSSTGNSNVTTYNSPALDSVSTANKLLYLVMYQANAARTVTASRGADSFTEIGNFWDDTSDFGMAWGYAAAPSAGTTAITATFSNNVNNTAFYVTEVSGLDAYVIGETANQAQAAPGTGTDAVTPGNITPSFQPSLLFGLCCNVSAANTPAAGTGFTSAGGIWTYGGGSGFARAENRRYTTAGLTAAAPTFTASNGGNRYLTVGFFFKEQTSSTQGISPGGIASVEAFGAAVVSAGAVNIAPSGIASEEAFGTAAITTGAVTIAPAGIASAEAFGTATISLATTEILPSGIASAEAFGTAAVTSLAHILPSGIASAEAFGTPRIGLYTIDGSLEALISTPYDNVTLYSDGSGNFYTVH